MTQTTSKYGINKDGTNVESYQQANSYQSVFVLDYDASVTTTNSYVRSIAFDVRAVSTGIIKIINTHASNDLYYQIRGSIAESSTTPSTSDASWGVIKNNLRVYNTASAADNSKIETFDNTFNFIEVQVKAATSGNQATCGVYAKSIIY